MLSNFETEEHFTEEDLEIAYWFERLLPKQLREKPFRTNFQKEKVDN